MYPLQGNFESIRKSVAKTRNELIAVNAMLGAYDFILEEKREYWGEVIEEYRIESPRPPYIMELPKEFSHRKLYYNPFIVQPEGGNFKLINSAYVEELERRDGFLYRGMNFKEMQEALKFGFIRSWGIYNFAAEIGLTVFTKDIGTAAIYAGGFAPWGFNPTFTKPGFIIEVRKDEKFFQLPQYRTDNWYTNYPIPVEDIVRVWMVNVGVEWSGTLELIFNKYTKEIKEGTRYSAEHSYYYKEITVEEAKILTLNN